MAFPWIVTRGVACGGTSSLLGAITSRLTCGHARMSLVWAASPLTWTTNAEPSGRIAKGTIET